jgi:U6 snRNA-associated Sm-like protein LSm2
LKNGKQKLLIFLLFYSFFKTLVGKEVIIELKNDIVIKGNLQSVDQYLNIKLDKITVLDEKNHP